MYALNFYSDLYGDVLRNNRKTVSIRLGDKSAKYDVGMLVWITVGPRFGRRQKLFAAILDRVEVKTVADLSPRDIERENPEFRTQDDVLALLGRVYGEFVTPSHTVTVVYFSRVDE
ncbi:MAG: RNA-binding protein [Armatimonadota bacterium]